MFIARIICDSHVIPGHRYDISCLWTHEAKQLRTQSLYGLVLKTTHDIFCRTL